MVQGMQVCCLRELGTVRVVHVPRAPILNEHVSRPKIPSADLYAFIIRSDWFQPRFPRVLVKFHRQPVAVFSGFGSPTLENVATGPRLRGSFHNQPTKANVGYVSV